MTDRKETDLDLFFAAAQEAEPWPTGDFMARVEADALANLPRPTAPATPGLWAQLAAALGGWQGMTGLATACAAGLWIGVSPPDFVETLWQISAGLEDGFGTLGVDPLSGFDLTLMEG